MTSLKNSQKNSKIWNPWTFLLLFFCISIWKDFYQNEQYWKQICHMTRKYTVCRCVHACVRACVRACACTFQPRNFTGWGSEWVNEKHPLHCFNPFSLLHPYIYPSTARHIIREPHHQKCALIPNRMITTVLGSLKHRHPFVIITVQREVDIGGASVGLSGDGQLWQHTTRGLQVTSKLGIDDGLSEPLLDLTCVAVAGGGAAKIHLHAEMP